MNQPNLPDFPPSSWMLDPNTTPATLEHVLLSIDVFPRCELLLTVYEGLPLDVAAVLMNIDWNLVRKGVALASVELTRHLAKMQGLVPDASVPEEHHPFRVELRYA